MKAYYFKLILRINIKTKTITLVSIDSQCDLLICKKDHFADNFPNPNFLSLDLCLAAVFADQLFFNINLTYSPMPANCDKLGSNVIYHLWLNWYSQIIDDTKSNNWVTILGKLLLLFLIQSTIYVFHISLLKYLFATGLYSLFIFRTRIVFEADYW